MGSMKVWNGTAWEIASTQGPAGPPGAVADPRELAYVELTSIKTVTSTATATADLLVTTPAIVFDGLTPILIEMFASQVAPSSVLGGVLAFYLWQDTTVIGKVGQVLNPAASGMTLPVYAARRLTPAAGTFAFSWRAIVAGGNGIVYGGNGSGATNVPAYIRISRAT